ncbi:MAG: tetratricopeptide repeat protein, partial [Anaerolineales bacterium]|nr:tetratricopeptide repeat protein [Anaerolineales bacterium]
VGYITYLLDDLDTAENHYQESLELSQELGDLAGTAWSLHNLGDIARARQDFQTARALYEQSYALHIKVDTLSWGGAVALDKLGRVRLEMGDWHTAEADFRLALEIAQKTERYREMLDALLNLAQVARRRGDEDTAVRLLVVVVKHPATARETYDTAVSLLGSKINTAVSSKASGASEASESLEQVVAEILGVVAMS